MADGDEATVTVRGDAVVRAEPDEARLRIAVSALEPSAGAAIAEVSRRSAALTALLDELGVAAPDRSTIAVVVEEEFEDRVSRGHRAVSRTGVRLADPDLIGELISEATEQQDVRIDGPFWSVRLDNPARLEAARRAAADARRRAEAYADGVGAKVGRLIALAEPGAPEPVRRALASSAGAGPMPVEHDVVATIYATFALDLS